MLLRMQADVKQIADKVRGLAAERHMTQSDIAEILKISRTAVVERFAGRVTFRAVEILVLARRWRISPASFFPSDVEEVASGEASV